MSKNHTSVKIRDLALGGILTALVFIGTYFIQIRLPISVNGGLVHLGNVVLFTAAILYGPRQGAVAGAFGMGLFDILSGWGAWAPFTFLIRGGMGYVIGRVSHSGDREGKNPLWNLLGILGGTALMIPGYYIAEGLLYGNWLAPATSIPGNLTQLAFGLTALALAPVLERAGVQALGRRTA